MDELDKIQEIKSKYGNQAESIIADGLGLVKKGKKYKCPQSSYHKNGDKDPSMSWDPKLHQFHCFTCGHNIDIYGYYREHLNYDHGEVMRELLNEDDVKATTMQKSRTTFMDEARKVIDITQECIEYIKLRGITEDTIKTFKLGTYKGSIAFPYYKNDTIVGYKTRKPIKNPGKPKMLSIKGSKPYLYNIQNIKPEGELVICEGEFDCMVIHQVGYSNVVSVGAGANSLSALIEQATEYLEKFTSLIIVSDNDDSGHNMDKLFLEKFKSKVKLIDKSLYDRNDINEEYVVNGESKVREIVESARLKIEGRRDLDLQPYKGITSGNRRYIPTGLHSIDMAINDLVTGCTTLVTGRSNDGKSTFVRQVIANAIDKNNKVYLMSGEGDQEILINELYQSVIGRDKKNYEYVKINKRYRKEPKPEILKKLQKWHKGKLVMFNKGDSKLKTIRELLDMLTTEIKVNNYELVVIDNLMSILSVQAAEKYEQQADFMQNLADMAKAYNTHIILVLHPNKTYQKGQQMVFEQISGSSDLYNKADNVIAVRKEDDEEKKAQGINGYISVLKNRYYPDLPEVEVNFHQDTGLLLEITDSRELLLYNFNWEGLEVPEGFQISTSEDCPF